jgi:hypothetical protein
LNVFQIDEQLKSVPSPFEAGSAFQQANRPTDQPTNQPNKQTTNQPRKQTNKPPTNQPRKQTNKPTTNQSIKKTTARPNNIQEFNPYLKNTHNISLLERPTV